MTERLKITVDKPIPRPTQEELLGQFMVQQKLENAQLKAMIMDVDSKVTPQIPTE